MYPVGQQAAVDNTIVNPTELIRTLLGEVPLIGLFI